MYNQSSTNQNERHEKKCDDKVKLPVERTIATLKNAYCTNLKGMVAELSESEVTYDGTLITYNSRKCNFVKTEKNYRLVRNLELSVGVELAQASEEIKKNVAASVKQNDDVLVKVALKDLLTSVKDAKTKFGELRDAAYKLDACRKDSCNASQMIIIGCRQGDDCNDKGNNNNEDAGKRPECCDNVCEMLEDLITIPESLSRDIDIILSSTVEIAGIQSFSNLKTLVDFQTDFSLNAKAFNDLLLAQMKTGSAAVTKAQEDLVTATTTLTQSAYVVYNKRMVVETADETKDYLCCHKCKCVGDDDCGCDDEHGEKKKEGHHNNDDSRLARCKCEICEICTELKDVYCKEPQPESSC